MRGDSPCGGHGMREHVPGKMIIGAACGDCNFLIPFIRVCPPQERAFAFWQADCQHRVW